MKKKLKMKKKKEHESIRASPERTYFARGLQELLETNTQRERKKNVFFITIYTITGRSPKPEISEPFFLRYSLRECNPVSISYTAEETKEEISRRKNK